MIFWTKFAKERYFQWKTEKVNNTIGFYISELFWAQHISLNWKFLNFKELLVRNRRDIRSLSDCNGARNHDQLVCKRTLNHLAHMAKWLSYVVSTYLYCAFDCMFLSYQVLHVRISLDAIFVGAMVLLGQSRESWSSMARPDHVQNLQIKMLWHFSAK